MAEEIPTNDPASRKTDSRETSPGNSPATGPQALPKTMRAIHITRPGGPEVLSLGEASVPQPGPGEVLVQVAAAGVNRADLMQRAGNYPPPAGASPILGLEVAGHVAEIGGDNADRTASRWQVGDAVCALLTGGGYAEYCAIPAGQCLPIPAGLTAIEAASLPEAALTVWANLFEPRRIFPGDLFLVQGGSSGIGAMAIQAARHFGARVAATAGSEEKCRFILGLGAEKAVDYHGDWPAELASWSKPHGIDVILDMVGADYFPRHLQLLALHGRLIQISVLRGSRAEIDLGMMMRKRLLITGSTLRSRPVSEKASLAAAVEQNLWPLFAARHLHPTVFKTFPLSQAAEAHQLMEASRHMGKLILTMGKD